MFSSNPLGWGNSKEGRINFDDTLKRDFPVLYPVEAWEKFLKRKKYSNWNTGFKVTANYSFQHLPYLLKQYTE